MSSEVSWSWRTVEMRKVLKIRLAMPSKNHTKGLSRKIISIIGRTTRTATRSGWVMAKRLGIRSANRIKRPVTRKNDNKEASVPAQAASPKCCNSAPK